MDVTPRAPVATPPPARVLLVEDNAVVRTMVVRLLTRAGHAVTAVGDGPAAFAALRADPLPDLVLLDLGLPGPSGADVVRALAADPRLAAVPVAILSGAAVGAGVHPHAPQVVAWLDKARDLPALAGLVARYARPAAA